MNPQRPERISALAIGPLSAALFGGYATGTVIMLLLWHLT